MLQNKMVIIDDLETEEAVKIVDFLQNAVQSDELDLAIQDCIKIADEVQFHTFVAENNHHICCRQCGKRVDDTIHQVVFKESY